MNSRYYKQQRIHYALIQSTTKKKPIAPGDVGKCWERIEEWKCESSFYWRFEWDSM